MRPILNLLIKLLPTKPVFAHCDIPCGIYDPHQAQLAAHTVIRMVSLIQEAGEDMHKISRCSRVKEKHADIVEQELETLWGDYFKKEHFEKFPDLSGLIYETVKLTGDVRQKVDPDASQKLLANTQKIAEIFYKTKGLEVIRIPSAYPTDGEIVTHK